MEAFGTRGTGALLSASIKAISEECYGAKVSDIALWILPLNP